MADIRTLKLNLLADTANFRKGLSGARKASDTFAGKVGLSFRKAAIGFAAVTAAAYGFVNVSTDLIRAAAEDEASQAKLRKALQNTASATDNAVKSTEIFIATQARQTGFSDTKLRPALAKLAGYTGDVAKAQDLLKIAMDVSTGTGKDLETVSLAIGKAYDGNYGALKRLGVPLDDNLVKMKDTAGLIQNVADAYNGQAAVAADTFAGKMQILNDQFGEFKEKVGKVLIDKLTGLLPFIMDVVDTLNGGGKKKSLADAMSATAREAAGDSEGVNLADALIAVGQSFGKLFTALSGGDEAASSVDNLSSALQRMASAINAVADAYTYLKSTWNKLPKLLQGALLGPILPTLDKLIPRAMGGVVGGSGSYLVGERGPEIFTPNGSGGGRITPNGGMGGTTIIMNGIVDGESARRSIERLLQQSARRSGAINLSPVLT